MYTMKEVSEEYSLSQYTIRYYDKEGLLPFVKRDQTGRRVFSNEDMEQIGLICCLKETGMSIKDIKEYVDLYQKKEFQEAKMLLINHRDDIVDQIKSLEANLRIIEDSIIDGIN